MNTILSGMKNILLWSHPRGTWQYDILCLLIIAAVFLVPGRYFGDRDRSVTALANRSGVFASNPPMQAMQVFEVEHDVLEAFLQRQNRADLIKDPRAAISLYLQGQLKCEVIEIKDPERITLRGKPAYRVRFIKELSNGN